MKLLVVLITYNRLDFTKRTLKSLLKTLKKPYFLVVVDNNSTDGTQEWLREQPIDLLIENKKNFYPGKACNIGWVAGLTYYPEAEFLMRSDNDMEYVKDFGSKWQKYFEKVKNLGQLGLDWTLASKAPGADMILDWQILSLKDENYRSPCQVEINGVKLIPWPGSIGGPNIIRREIWDMGIRYDEKPWHRDKNGKFNAFEDPILTSDILRAGWTFGHAGEKLAITYGNPDRETLLKYPDYYKGTLKYRNIEDSFENRVKEAGLENIL